MISLVKWKSLKEAEDLTIPGYNRTEVNEKKLLNLPQISDSSWNVLLKTALLNAQVPNIPFCLLMSLCLPPSPAFMFMGNRFKEKVAQLTNMHGKNPESQPFR